jgi:putative inorganic carbon (hco3(-)) transporter
VQIIKPLQILQALPLLAFIALIVFLPSVQFMPKTIIWFNDRQRLLELLLVSMVLLNYVFKAIFVKGKVIKEIAVKKDLLPIPQQLRLAFYALLLLAIISAGLAQSPRHAMIEISVFAGLCYLSLFAANLYLDNNQKFIYQFTVAIWASIALYIVSFYTGYITATIFKTPLNWPFPFTGFSNIRSFNQYQLWSLALICLPLLAFEVKKNMRILLQIALIAWWVLLFYSASRGVLVAWLAGMVFTAAIYKKSAWQFLRLQLINIMLGFCSYYLLFTAIPALRGSALVTGTVIRGTGYDRLALWQQAIILMQQSPIFGVGPMHYAWYNNSNGHPHNSLLQLAAEWGLPAALIIMCIAGYGMYSWLKKFNANSVQALSKLESNMAILLFFTIVANAAYSLVDGVIVTPISQVLMFSIIGLMIGFYCDGQLDRNEHKTIRNKVQFRPIFAVITLATMITTTLPEIRNGLTGHLKEFSMGYFATGPRFWHEKK